MPEADDNNSGWFRKNVATMVTWLLVLLTAAVAWGNTTADLGAVQSTVKEMRVEDKVRDKEDKARDKDLETLRSDVRVSEERVSNLSSRIERAVSRLEAVAKELKRDR